MSSSTAELVSPSPIPADPNPTEPAKRRQILDGARRAFLSRGFDGTSMGEVAREAAVSKGTLYVYFDNKESLFEALTIEEKRGQAEALLRLETDDPDVRGALRRLALDVMQMMVRPDHVAAIRMIIGTVERFPRFGRAFYEAGPEQGHARVTTYIAAQIAAGRLCAADPAVAAQHYFDLCHSGMIRRLIFGVTGTGDETERAHLIEQALDVFFAAYGPRPDAPGGVRHDGP